MVFQSTNVGLQTAFLMISNDTPIPTYKINFEGSNFRLSTNTGPYWGGNTITITNGTLGNGSDITNILVGGVSTTNIVAQGVNWVTFKVPPAGSAGVQDIVIQSASVGASTLYASYIYNSTGSIYSAFGPSVWKSLGSKQVPGQLSAIGMQNTIYGLGMGPDGILYAAGAFTNAGGSNCYRVARFDGTNWTEMGGGIVQFANANVIRAWTNGIVYAGGYFTNIGGINSRAIAKWNGTNWVAMGNGLFFSQFVNGYVNDIRVGPNGDVYAGGYFTNADYTVKLNYIARWNGVMWTNMGPGFSNVVNCIAVSTNGVVYAGGSFTNSGNTSVRYIAKWTGTAWTNVGTTPLGNRITCMAMAKNGDLYVGGWFTNIGPMEARYIAKWNGTSWTNLGAGFNNWVYAIDVDNNGNVVAGGAFTNSGSMACNRIALWNGTSWTNLGSGMNDSILSLGVNTNDNSINAGGFFKLAGGSSCWYVAKWVRASGSGVEPSSGSVSGGYPVVISGTNLCNGADVTDVTLCGVSVTSIVSQSATQVTVMAGAASAAGLGDVRVYSMSFGETIRSNAFTYNGAVLQILGTNGAVVGNGEAAGPSNGTDFGVTLSGLTVTNTLTMTNFGKSDSDRFRGNDERRRISGFPFVRSSRLASGGFDCIVQSDFHAFPYAILYRRRLHCA